MIKEELFNIPMWSTEIEDFFDKKKKIEKILKSIPEERTGIQTFLTNRHIIRESLSENFSKVFNEELSNLVKDLNKNITIDDVWSISYKKDDYHMTHNHGSLGLTGIIYLNMPKDASNTYYIQPWNNWISDKTNHLTFPVKEGTMIIIPKFINHFTLPNKSKKIKRVISWDMSVLN